MKRIGVDGGFLLCLGINLILNLGWTIPAWIALILHFVIGISLWWFVGALGLWFLATLLITLFLSFIISLPSKNAKPAPTAEEKARRREEIREYSRNIKNMNK